MTCAKEGNEGGSRVATTIAGRDAGEVASRDRRVSKLRGRLLVASRDVGREGVASLSRVASKACFSRA